LLDTLAAGAADTVTFGAWTATPLGTHTVTCFTSLTGDTSRGNDTVRTSVTVNRVQVHDVGAAVILSPPLVVHEGDTVLPTAIIRNFGTVMERYFDVRFRIGVVYNEAVTVTSDLQPDGTIDLPFPRWTARLGAYLVSCSTMLARDTNRANDKVTTSIVVLPRLALRIEPDYLVPPERLEVGATRTLGFWAMLEGSESDVVELVPPTMPSGWTGVLFDSAGRDTLRDTDGDSRPDLGAVPPGVRRYFNLRVEAPQALAGDTGQLAGDTVVIAGFARSDRDARDSALLALRLVPELSVHNFPNPLEDHTVFVIGLPEDGDVTLGVFDRTGACVSRIIGRDGPEDLAAGVYHIPWDATNEHGLAAAPGTYQYVLDCTVQGKRRRIVKKLVVVRH
jgi:hypothetical protein